MKRFLGLSALVLAIFLMLPSGLFAGEELQVFVSILPQKYFVEQVGGDILNVQSMVMPGADPHTYEPKPQQMVSLTKAKAYFSIGVGFEKVWLPKIKAANPNMPVIPTDEGVKKIPMKVFHHEKKTKQLHEKDAHSENDHHGILDPHIWTTPSLVMIQAKNILAGLIKIDPNHRLVYEANCRKFIKTLEEIDTEFKTIFSGNKDLAFMVFHPAWGYFAEAYGLKQIPAEIEGKKPKPAQLRYLIEHARKRGIKVIFAQPQLSSQSAETIARAIGGKVVFADPLAYDWVDNIRRQAKAFEAALR